MDLRWRAPSLGAPLLAGHALISNAMTGVETRSLEGELLWSADPGGLVIGVCEGRALVLVGTGETKRLVQRQIDSGLLVAEGLCLLNPSVLIEGAVGTYFAGTSVVRVSEREFEDWVGVGTLGPPVRLLWSRKAEEASQFSTHVASDEKALFVGCGADLLALSVDKGVTVWKTCVAEMGDGPADNLHWWVMVAEGVVVTNTRRATAAYSAATGHYMWAHFGGGVRAIYGGRVYFMHDGAYQVLDLHSGAVLLRREVAREIEEKWSLEQVQFESHPAVSETHAFVGDARGRLFGFVRDTGEPVWYDQPPGVTTFMGAMPVIAGRRLYISSFSIDPKRPSYLYCYEEAPEGSWEPPKTTRKRKSGRM